MQNEDRFRTHAGGDEGLGAEGQTNGVCNSDEIEMHEGSGEANEAHGHDEEDGGGKECQFVDKGDEDLQEEGDGADEDMRDEAHGVDEEGVGGEESHDVDKGDEDGKLQDGGKVDGLEMKDDKKDVVKIQYGGQ